MRRLLLLPLFTACTSADHAFLLLPERAESTKSLVAILEREGAIEAIATDSAAPRIEGEREGLLRVTLLGYDQPLTDLGMSAGSLPLSTGDACGRRPLPPAQRSWVAELEWGDGAFVAGADLSEAALGVRVRVPCPCVELRKVGEAILDTPLDTYALLAVDDQHVVARSDRSYLIDRSAAIVETQSYPATLYSGYRGPDGRLWFGTSTSSLAIGAWNDLHPLPMGGTADTHWIDGPHSDGVPFELFILSYEGPLWHFDGTERRNVWNESLGNSKQLGAIAWIGPDEAIASQESGLDLLWYKAGTTQVEPWARPLGFIFGVDYVGPPYEAVIGTATGRVFAGRPGAFVELQKRDPPELDGPLRGFTAFRGGMLAVGDSSSIIQHHPDAGFCSVQRFNAGIDFHEVVVLGDRIFVAGHPNSRGSPGSAVNSSVLVLEVAD